MPAARTLVALLGVAWAAACSHDAQRENPLDPELTPGVTIQARLDDSAATVALTWTPYEGEVPFSSYCVQRKVQGQEEWLTLDTLLTAAQTAYVDRALEPDTAYDYQVVVTSAGGFAVPSNKASVGGYSVTPVALLPVEEDAREGALWLRWTRSANPGFGGYEVLRRPVGTDRDTVLFAGAARTDTSFADTSARHRVPYSYAVRVASSGQLLRSEAREATLELPSVGTPRVVADPATATARVAWDPYEGPAFAAYEVWRRTETQTAAVLTSLAEVTDTSATDGGLLGNTVYHYRVVVRTTRGEEVASAEGGDGIYLWERSWPVTSVYAGRVFMRLYGSEGGGVTAVVVEGRFPHSYVREMAYDAAGAEIQLAGWVTIGLASSLMQVAEVTTGDGGSMRATAVNRTTVDRTDAIFAYRLTAVSAEGTSLIRPEESGVGSPWVGLARAGSLVLHVKDDEPFVVEGDSVYRAGDQPLEDRVSEIRTWTDGRSWRVGVCLPQVRKVQWGTVPEQSMDSWPTYLTRTSTAANRAGDPVDYPVSFDFAPDAGLVVLDAGRARILVLDRLGRYITQFGRFGDGEGEFDFGRGQTILQGQPDYAGSLAVDGEGNVYVADELNARIQKFEP